MFGVNCSDPWPFSDRALIQLIQTGGGGQNSPNVKNLFSYRLMFVSDGRTMKNDWYQCPAWLLHLYKGKSKIYKGKKGDFCFFSHTVPRNSHLLNFKFINIERFTFHWWICFSNWIFHPWISVCKWQPTLEESTMASNILIK